MRNLISSRGGLTFCVFFCFTGFTLPLANAASTTVVAWGAGTTNGVAHPSYEQSLIPPNLTNAQSIAAGQYHSLAVREDGTVVAWGWNAFNQTSVPAGLTNVVAVAGGWYHSLALKADGTVVAWGNGIETEANVPGGLTNVVAIAAGKVFSLALRRDGTVANWGNSYMTPPAGLTNVVAIASGESHGLALKRDGTVTIWGSAPFVSAPGWGVFDMPAGVTDVVGIAAGAYQSILLKADGTLITWGQWSGPAVPAGLTNVVAVATGGHNVAITRDGNIVAWGYNEYGQATVPGGISNAVAIAAGTVNTLAILGDGSPVIARHPMDRTAYSGTGAILGVGAVGAPPLAYQWQLNGTNLPSATNAWIELTNVQPPVGGQYRAIVSNAFGVATSSNATLAVMLAPPNLQTHPVGQIVAVGSNVSFTCSAVGSLPLRYQWQLNETNILNATNSTLNLTNLLLPDEGNYRVVISNDFGSAPSSNAFVNVVDLPEALNASGFTWTTAGDAPWAPQFSVTHDGTAAASSGLVGDNQHSVLETAIVGPGAVSFWWRVSSETNDLLTVAVNGVTQAAISGGSNWRQQTVYLGVGSQTVRWVFTRDASGSSGQDRGWVDEVVFTPGTTPAGIVTHPRSQTAWPRTPVTMSTVTAGTPPLRWQWQFNGSDIVGATNASLAIPGATYADAGSYRVLVTNDYGGGVSSNGLLKVEAVAVWGSSSYGLTNIPANLTNAIALATGGNHILALRSNGTVVAWGRNTFGQTNVPAGLSNVIAIAAGYDHSLALMANGTVLAWGYNGSGQTNVPSGLSNVVAIAAGANMSVAIRANGTISIWGYNSAGPAPAAASNAVAVAMSKSAYNGAALRGDGRIVIWPGSPPGYFIPNLSNLVSVAAGSAHLLALTGEGAVFAGGMYPAASITNVPGLSNAVAIAAGDNHNLALRPNGTVAASGNNTAGQLNIPSTVTNAVAVAAGGNISVALFNDGSPFLVRQPISQTILSGGAVVFELVATGSGLLHYQWQLDGVDLPGATNALLMLNDVPVTSAGAYQCLVSNALGTTVSLPVQLAVARTTLRFENSPLSPQLTSSGLIFKLTGLSGHGEIIIHASTNLMDWEPLFTNPPAVGSLQWLDQSATNSSLRFYRGEEK